MADTLTFYQSEGSDQWRWRYRAEGNNEAMANGGEEYHSLEMCMESAYRVCGLGGASGQNLVSSAGATFAREHGPEVLVQIHS